MRTAFFQALWLALPVVSGGIVHVMVIKVGWFDRLARVPLDFGMHLRGKRLFGDNKTLRGALVMTLATGAMAVVARQLVLSLSPQGGLPWFQTASPFVWGMILGLGYVAGELPNSFVKRQLDVPPGEIASRTRAPLRLAG